MLGGGALMASTLTVLYSPTLWLELVAGSKVTVSLFLAEVGFVSLGILSVVWVRVAVPETLLWWASIFFAIAISIRAVATVLIIAAGYGALLHYAIAQALAVPATVGLGVALFRADVLGPFQAAALVTGSLVLGVMLVIPSPLGAFALAVYGAAWLSAGVKVLVSTRSGQGAKNLPRRARVLRDD